MWFLIVVCIVVLATLFFLFQSAGEEPMGDYFDDLPGGTI